MKNSYLAVLLLPLSALLMLGAEKAPKSDQPSPPEAAPTLSFPTRVEQVVVDVVVTDKTGNAVRGLKPEDMTVLEDGQPQNVVSFEAIELPEKPPAAPPPRPRVSVNTSPEDQRGRTFAIIFDDTHLTPWRANKAKAAVASFLEKGVREGDRVMLVTTAGGMWWTARMTSGRAQLIDSLKRLDGRYIPETQPDRLSEYEAWRIHEYHDSATAQRVLRRWDTYGVTTTQRSQASESSGLASGTVDDPVLTGRATEVYQMAVTRIRATLDTIERVTSGLAAAKGRKSVILVSEGFIEDYNLPDFKRVIQTARRANAVIYFVNARGLDAMPTGMTAQFGPALPDQDMGGYFAEALDAVRGAESVADDSGGFTVRNTNDLAAGIERIAKETQAYYLLGYIPSNPARDGKFRKIQVKLTQGKGLHVRARKGYYAPSDTAAPTAQQKRGVDPVFQEALDSPWMQDGIPLRLTDYVGDEKMLGKAAVRLAAELDPRAVQFEEKDGRSCADLDFLMVVAHRQTGEYFRYDQSYQLKLLPTTRERITRLWMPIVRDFELAPGDYQAKVIVRDKRSGRVGTVMHEFSVPVLGGFRTSTPVLSDTRAATPSEEGVPGGILTPLARREFGSGSELLCQFEVYGAKKDEQTGMPRVLQGYVVKRPDGSVLAAMAPSAIKPTSLGHLSRLFGFRLVDAPPGEYDLMMTLRDDLSGTSIERHEPFTVVPAFGFAPAAPVASESTPSAKPAESGPADSTPPEGARLAPSGTASSDATGSGGGD